MIYAGLYILCCMQWHIFQASWTGVYIVSRKITQPEKEDSGTKVWMVRIFLKTSLTI